MKSIKKYLYNTSIIGSVLLSSSSSQALDSKVELPEQYSPFIELSTKNSKKRNITEIDCMQPVLGNDNFLSLLDLKLKIDNSKSKELNLGFAIRYNFDDRVVLGFYNYFDHRRTENNFIVNGWTTGVEAMSKYIDARVNFYVPENKKKKIAHNHKKKAELQGTRLYAVFGGHEYEYALKGYDIEIGGPIFGFSDNLNEKFGTKIFVAKYDFRNKNTKSITGTRFRLQQSLGSLQLGNNSLDFTLNAETQYDKVRKRQNFIGLGAKITFDNKTNYKKNLNSLKSRMTETIVRDVDIVIASAKANDKIINFFDKEGREIYDIKDLKTGGTYSAISDDQVIILNQLPVPLENNGSEPSLLLEQDASSSTNSNDVARYVLYSDFPDEIRTGSQMQIQPVIDHEDQVGHIQEVIEQEVQLIQEDLMEVIVHEDQVIQVIEQADQNLQIPEVVIEQADQVIQVIEQEVQLQPAPNPDLDEDLLPLWWMQMIEGLELGPANLGQLGQIEHVVGQAVVDHVGHIQEDLMEVIVHEDQVIQVIEQEVQLIQEGHNHEDHLPQWMLNMIRQRPVGYINMNLIQMHAYQNQAEEKR